MENMGAQFCMFPDGLRLTTKVPITGTAGLACLQGRFEIVNIASDGPVVLTERLDYIQTPNGRVIEYRNCCCARITTARSPAGRTTSISI